MWRTIAVSAIPLHGGDTDLRRFASSLPGWQMQGGNFPDVTYTNVYSADGAVNGNAWKNKVWFTKIKGKWSIDASGQLCADLMNDRQEKITGCQLFYAAGTSYYAVRGDNRAAEAVWRTISR
jgi:hypothetical protein